MASKFKIGDLVWAKMKGFPPWPGKVIEPKSNVKRPSDRKPKQFVFFFGSENYAWILEESIYRYVDHKDQFETLSRVPRGFKEALVAIEDALQKNPEQAVKSPDLPTIDDELKQIFPSSTTSLDNKDHMRRGKGSVSVDWIPKRSSTSESEYFRTSAKIEGNKEGSSPDISELGGSDAGSHAESEGSMAKGAKVEVEAPQEGVRICMSRAGQRGPSKKAGNGGKRKNGKPSSGRKRKRRKVTEIVETRKGKVKEEWGESGSLTHIKSRYPERKGTSEKDIPRKNGSGDASGKVRVTGSLLEKHGPPKEEMTSSERQRNRKGGTSGKRQANCGGPLAMPDVTVKSGKCAEHDRKQQSPAGQETVWLKGHLETETCLPSTLQLSDQHGAMDADCGELKKGDGQQLSLVDGGSETAGSACPASYDGVDASHHSAGNLIKDLDPGRALPWEADTVSAGLPVAVEDSMVRAEARKAMVDDTDASTKEVVTGASPAKKGLAMLPRCCMHLETLRVGSTPLPPLDIEMPQWQRYQAEKKDVRVPSTKPLKKRVVSPATATPPPPKKGRDLVKHITPKGKADMQDEAQSMQTAPDSRVQIDDYSYMDPFLGPEYSPALAAPAPPKNIIATPMKIGFLGLGIMGTGMVNNLLVSGHEVTVWNRTPSKCREFVKEGALKASSPAEVVQTCDITFSSVSDPPALKDLVFGNCGVLQGIEQGKAFVDMSTVDVETIQDINEAVTARGGRFLEAPVIGSRQPSLDGQLVILAAGDKSLYDDCYSCFQAMGRKTFYLGEVGSAAKMKLVTNMLLGTVLAGLSECLSLAEKVGLDQEEVMEILQMSPINCSYIRTKGRAMLSSRYNNPDCKLQVHQKDLQLALIMSDTVDQPLHVSSAVTELFKKAKAKGYGEHDTAAVYRAAAL